MTSKDSQEFHQADAEVEILNPGEPETQKQSHDVTFEINAGVFQSSKIKPGKVRKPQVAPEF